MSIVFCSLPEVLGNYGGDNIQPKWQLTRCVSLPSRLNHAAMNIDTFGYTRRISVYSPVHSPPTELSQDKQRRCGQLQIRDSNIDGSHLRQATQEHREHPIEVYTKIQTQLYPQMRF
jgi:hypothetical protein